MALNPKMLLKLGLAIFGVVLIWMGAVNLLTQSAAVCITVFIFPIGCVGNAVGWIGGIATAVIGLGVLWLALRVV